MRRHARIAVATSVTVVGLLIGAAYAPAAGDRHATAAAKLAAQDGKFECKAGQAHKTGYDQRDF